MSKFPVILIATVISVVMAAPNVYNLGQWNQNPNQHGFNSYNNQPPIDWNQYGNEGNNGLISYPNQPQNDWNKYPNGDNNGLISYPIQPQNDWNKYPNGDNNGIDFHPNGPPNQWNGYPNGGNNGFDSHPNQPPNSWINYPNGGNINQIGPGHQSGLNKITDCGPTEVWKDVPGMDFWCRANCFHIPKFCPSSHCRCW